MSGVVRPSSLNYKISLLEAVGTYIKKEKLQADQYWDVDIEEHNGRTGPKQANFELLDDALFNLLPLPKSSTAAFYNRQGGKDNAGLTKNKRDSSTQLQNQWEREEEQIRKKLERNSISLMKSKIASQNRAN